MGYQQRKMSREEYESFLKKAAGVEPAGLVLKNATYLDVFTNSFKTNDIAISHGNICGIGQYSGKQEVDMTGKTVVPGFIDAHIHIESTTVVPETFAKEALKHGTCAVLTDPHEIANVMGIEGIKYMLEASKDLPLDILFMFPSCVPSCEFDESGAVITAADMEELFDNPQVYGVAELMDVNGVVSRRPEVLDKVVSAVKNDKLIDGHSPLVTGNRLNAYIAAGVLTDHECTYMGEAMEKLGLGMWIMIREGTAAQNLEELLPLCREPYSSRCMFCTDDGHINYLMEEGYIDHIIRKAIKMGADPVLAYKMASYTAGDYFGLRNRGAIAPGFLADLVVLKDVKNVDIDAVYKSGYAITDEYLDEHCKSNISPELKKKAHDTFHMPDITADMIRSEKEIPVLGLVEGQIVTTRRGFASRINVENDILKAVVVERHKNSGHIGVGFVTGYGMKKGAIATSVAHDAHNVIAIGVSDEEIAAAINELKKIGGGMIVCCEGKVLAKYPLPVAGLMSEVPAVEAKAMLDGVHEAAYKLGVNKGIDPFMTLSFTALPVIPEIRITTQGVFDVDKWKLV